MANDLDEVPAADYENLLGIRLWAEEKKTGESKPSMDLMQTIHTSSGGSTGVCSRIRAISVLPSMEEILFHLVRMKVAFGVNRRNLEKPKVAHPDAALTGARTRTSLNMLQS